MNNNDIHDALARYPTQQAAAQSWGLSPQFVCDMTWRAGGGG